MMILPLKPDRSDYLRTAGQRAPANTTDDLIGTCHCKVIINVISDSLGGGVDFPTLHGYVGTIKTAPIGR